MCAGRRLHLRKRFRIQVLVDTFDDQVYVVVARKRLRKGSNGRQRVLSLEVAGEIEDEQEHKGIRTDAKAIASGLPRASSLVEQDGWHPHDGYRRNCGQGVGNEGAGRPDLVVVVEAIQPFVRKAGQLPEPHADVVVILTESVFAHV